MHYHVIVVKAGAADPAAVVTCDRWQDAEDCADAMSKASKDWLPTRYPGRPWKPGEVTCYVDRRPFARGAFHREVSVVRCGGTSGLLEPECLERTDGTQVVGSPPGAKEGQGE